jgi:BolA protein
MSREERIKQKLTEAFDVEALEIVNESHMHAGPRTESHFKIFMVSKDFNGLNRVERQQKVYSLMGSEIEGGLHALSLRLKTPEENQKGLKSFQSPDCKHKV